MKNWRGKVGLVGVCCSSLCFLGLPVIMALIPSEWMGSTFFQWSVRIMVFVSLYFSISSVYKGCTVHHNFWPLLILAPASIALALLSFYLVSRPIGWLALGAFIVSFAWNHVLLRKLQRTSCH